MWRWASAHGARPPHWRAARRQPTAGAVGDIGRAVLAALVETGLVAAALSPDHVTVSTGSDGTVEVGLDPARTPRSRPLEPDDSTTFATAIRQALGPVREPRHLIERRQRVGRVFWHAVPELLGTNRTRADALSRHWRRWVGGGRLVYGRSDEGRAVIVAARSQRRLDLRSAAFDRWW